MRLRREIWVGSLLAAAVIAVGFLHAQAPTPPPRPAAPAPPRPNLPEVPRPPAVGSPSLPAASPVPEAKPESVPLDGNYVLTLYPAGKEGGATMAVVVATPEFSVQSEKPFVRFSGTLHPQQSGGFLLEYVLVSSQEGKVSDFTQTGTITRSGVLLRPGEPAQIVKNGEQFYNLRLERYQPAGADKSGLANAAPAHP